MRLSIHGSCVSRDTFEFLPKGTELERYIARQSLISAGSTADGTIDPEQLTSAFQRRMLTNDVAGDAFDQLREVADQTDLLVCDLCDERLGIFTTADGSTLTRTVEGLANELYPESGLTLHELGEDDHFTLFVEAVDRWAEVIEEVGLSERVVMLHVPWAARTIDGEDTPPSFRLSADLANVTYSRYYYAVFDRLNPYVIRPRVPVVAQSDHHWGPAPFHYVDEVHADLAEQLAELAERLGTRTDTTSPKE